MQGLLPKKTLLITAVTVQKMYLKVQMPNTRQVVHTAGQPIDQHHTPELNAVPLLTT